ncbi:hypothetical protein JZU68_05375, partial [bacterium]|nr:hypothetical protein [bacterium]
AMHGAILADALRVPWYPITNSTEILHFKWHDWFRSMNIDKDLHLLPIVWPQRQEGTLGYVKSAVKEYFFDRELRKIKLKGRFVLAKDSLLEQRKVELKTVFYNFNLLMKRA